MKRWLKQLKKKGELYEKAKKRNTTPPEHKLSRVYKNAIIYAWKVSDEVINLSIEGDVKWDLIRRYKK